MSKAEELGPGGVNDLNRPVFIASEPRNYIETLDHPLTNEEKLQLNEYKLSRALRSIERRDEVYKNLTSSYYAANTRIKQALGTPYPIIETVPTMLDIVWCIRPYEHILSLLWATAVNNVFWSLPSARVIAHVASNKRLFFSYNFVFGELIFYLRSKKRLKGEAENDYECMKYGVLETKERLEQRKQRWEKFAAYKEEWCRRYDFHLYNMRPEDRYTFFSPSLFPHWRPRFMKNTDYPLRKNPDVLTTTPLRDMFHEAGTKVTIPQNDKIPLLQARPELKWLRKPPNDSRQDTWSQTASSSTSSKLSEEEIQ